MWLAAVPNSVKLPRRYVRVSISSSVRRVQAKQREYGPAIQEGETEEEAHPIHERMGIAIYVECPTEKGTSLFWLIVFLTFCHLTLDPGAIGFSGLKTMTFSPSDAASNMP